MRRPHLGKATALLIIVVALSGCARGDDTAGPSRTTPPGVYRDDFRGTMLGAEWIPYHSIGTGGIGWVRPENVRVDDGQLILTARRFTAEDRADAQAKLGELYAQYAQTIGAGTAAGLCMCGPGKPDFTFGTVTVRARMSPGIGVGPAIGMWPDELPGENDAWPRKGEHDLFESPDGDRKTVSVNTHWGADENNHHQSAQSVPTDATDWHTYTMVKTPTEITFLIDGRVVHSVTDPEAIPAFPMHVFAQLDHGPQGEGGLPARDASTPDRVELRIDYVEITPTGGPAAATATSSPLTPSG